jgi:hypothetical protein
MMNTFYCGWKNDKPVVSNPDFEDGEVKLVELYTKRKDAIEKGGHDEVRKVRIFLVPSGEQSQLDYDIKETFGEVHHG